MYPLRLVSLKYPMWPGTADKYVSLIYGGAVKWLLRVINTKLVSFWRQCHRAGKEVRAGHAFLSR